MTEGRTVGQNSWRFFVAYLGCFFLFSCINTSPSGGGMRKRTEAVRALLNEFPNLSYNVEPGRFSTTQCHRWKM